MAIQPHLGQLVGVGKGQERKSTRAQASHLGRSLCKVRTRRPAGVGDAFSTFADAQRDPRLDSGGRDSARFDEEKDMAIGLILMELT
jgi:hypothetical protein